GTLAGHLAAEQALVKAVTIWRASQAPRPRWEGPGLYRVVVTDRYGSDAMTVAMVSEDEMLEAFAAQDPTIDQVVDVVYTGPIPGAGCCAPGFVSSCWSPRRSSPPRWRAP